MEGGRACIVFPHAPWDTSGCDVLIVADSGVSWADIRGSPDLIVVVTDGDGGIGGRLGLAEYSMFLAHQHGDNPWLPMLWEVTRPAGRGALILTGQVEVPKGLAVLSPFGFTDGDRSILLAASLGASVIEFSMADVIHHKGAPEIKTRKLELYLNIAREIMDVFGYECGEVRT